MNSAPTTFWEKVCELREKGRAQGLDLIWKRADLHKYLGLEFAATTINTAPSNYSISMEGNDIGKSVENGQSPKAWRVGRGQFQLIEDPDDDIETQRAQMRLAMKRAEELRERKRNTAIHSEIVSASQSSVAQSKPETVPSDMYSTLPVALTEGAREKADDLSTEQKALNIVRALLKDRYGEDVVIEEDRDGADLRVMIDGKTERIEVKGTKDSDIAWHKLKVSSKKSHDALVSGAASIYRVVDVDSANPCVHILIYGEDFILEPEPRWAVKRIPPNNERYPMRGLPYRYERPHDPVALEDWEILK